MNRRPETGQLWSPSLEIKTAFTLNASTVFSWIQKFNFKSILTAVHKGKMLQAHGWLSLWACSRARDNRAVWLFISLKSCSLLKYMNFRGGSPSEALVHCCGTGICVLSPVMLGWSSLTDQQINDMAGSSSHLVWGSFCHIHSSSLTSNLLQSTFVGKAVVFNWLQFSSHI